MDILVIIPVYNPDGKFKRLLNILQIQSLNNLSVLLIDSGTQHEYKKHIKADSRFVIKEISSNEFNHGGTRQLGINMYPDKDLYVFLTQDAVLVSENTIEHLIRCFEDKSIGCAFGRQLPHENASFFARVARDNNYGKGSYVYSFECREKYGIKTCFISNSYAAYRKTAMYDVQGFPNDTILSEDMYVAAKMLMKGWKVAYDADSQVYHSHNYSIWQEFKRYFDIGVFHARESWIGETFGKAEGEGVKFIKKEINLILHDKPVLLFEMIVRDGMKFLGYRLGIMEKNIPVSMKRIISMNRGYWG